MRLPSLAFAIAIFAPAAALPAQALTLREALLRAETSAFPNRIAAGNASASAAQATQALRGILPSLRVEGGYVRTTDPIGVFGTTLRQRTITQADFDPARLNHPSAVGNYLGGVIVEQPLLNADAWIGRRAATHAVGAARATEDWTRITTRTDVIRAYFGATMAKEKVATLAAAVLAAQGHVRQAEAMVRQGLATKSDALLAAVKAGELEAQHAEADADAGTALRQLALALGADASFTPHVPEHMPSAERIRRAVAGDTADGLPSNRYDVQAARAGLDAARSDRLRARSLYLPRLNAFARYDWNSATSVYDGDRSWTAGVMASWTPFAGASEIAEQQAATGRERAARAMAEGAAQRAELEAAQAGNALRAALARLAIAERAVAQSAEAHRIVARKYAGGLATAVELLDAFAIETQSALGLSAARYAAITAGAARRQALGHDPATLAGLEDEPVVAATSR